MCLHELTCLNMCGYLLCIQPHKLCVFYLFRCFTVQWWKAVDPSTQSSRPLSVSVLLPDPRRFASDHRLVNLWKKSLLTNNTLNFLTGVTLFIYFLFILLTSQWRLPVLLNLFLFLTSWSIFHLDSNSGHNWLLY